MTEKMKIDHEIVHGMVYDSIETKKKWNEFVKANPIEEEVCQICKEPCICKDDEKHHYTDCDFNGHGRIKKGQTIQITIVKVSMKGDKFDFKEYHSKIYKIRKSYADDLFNGLIKGGDVGVIPIKTATQADVMELFWQEKRNFTISEMANITGLSRNTVYRICKHFISHGLLKREEDLSYTLINEETIINLARPVDVEFDPFL